MNEKVSAGEREKEEGNCLVKSGDYQRAIRRYHYALMHLKGVENPAIMQILGAQQKKLSASELQRVKQLRCQCYNNLAVCLDKKGNYTKVIEYTTKVLDDEPENVKALFRRGKAFLRERNVDKAFNDFSKIKSINKNEKSVDAYFPLIEQERERQLVKSKQLFKKMMNT